MMSSMSYFCMRQKGLKRAFIDKKDSKSLFAMFVQFIVTAKICAKKSEK